MEAIATIAAVCMLALLAFWGAVRSRGRHQAAQQVHDEITRTLDRLERAAARLDELDSSQQEATPASEKQLNPGGDPRVGVARVYESSLAATSVAESAQDLASRLAGVIFRDVLRAVERDETVFLTGSYGPSGARIALLDRAWPAGAHTDTEERTAQVSRTNLAINERSLYWHVREGEESTKPLRV